MSESKSQLRNRIAYLEHVNTILRRDRDQLKRLLVEKEDDRVKLLDQLNAAVNADRFGHLEGRDNGHPELRPRYRNTPPDLPGATRHGFNPIGGQR